MAKQPFIVTHDGRSFQCFLHLNGKKEARHIEVVPTEFSSMAAKMFACIENLNDLMSADVPFDALASCRNSPGLYGAIIDPAATELENLRATLAGSGDVA